ncbi:MAG: undecaprenyldiphospho-muramoylpentapeptide beta-N-acetylglucosaminyltransferase [Pseudomonadota bacterium]
MSDNNTVIIAAGGTGGHVFPALAVADELKSRNVNVLWVGSERGMESTLVPAHGLPLHTLRVSALRGKGVMHRLGSALRLLTSIVRSVTLIRNEKPRAVLGMGGYVAGPVCVAARLCRTRTIMHEQNAVAGMTNRIVKKFATRVLEAVPGTFAADVGAVHTGNPVRKDILNLSSPEQRIAVREGAIRILVVGGSQGAQTLNQWLPQACGMGALNVSIRHQAGKGRAESTRDAYAGCDATVEVSEFVDDMAAAYEWADLLICRAGAMTVAEVSAVGVASLLVPYPYAVDDHQTANGQFLVQADAAVMLQESDLTAAVLHDYLKTLCADRQRLLEMATNARRAGNRNATELVVNEILGEAA